MATSFRTKQRRRMARRSKRRAKLEYRFAIHEVGHYVAKSRLLPDISLNLTLKEVGKRKQFLGEVYNPEDPEKRDTMDVMIRVSIAGSIAEARHVDKLHRAYDYLRDISALKEDKVKFEHSKKYSAWPGPDVSELGDRECFEQFQSEILRMFDDYGWAEMEKLAKQLVAERLIVIPASVLE
ncbi:MAG: hypothetical protein V7707_06340 [Motiliproteus sp.]